MKHSNDTLKLNINKYTNYNIIEKYINRLTATAQIFIAMDYSILMSKNGVHFKKKTKAFDKEVEVIGSMHFGNIFRIMCFCGFSKICTKT